MERNYKKYLDKVLYPILLVCGPSGGGKSTLIKLIVSTYGVYELVISYTTRELTREEKAAKLYVHVSKNKFETMIKKGLFAEYNYYEGSDSYYGTPWSEIFRILKAGKVPALDIDINGLINLDKLLLRMYTFRVYLDVNLDNQERRIIKRGRPTDTAKKIQSRLKIAIKERQQ
jgi:guanylate kinase